MNSYIPTTSEDEQKMLREININNIEELFDDIPKNIKFNKELNLKAPMAETELISYMKEIGFKNKKDLTCFLGAGAYDHYIPSIIKHIISRSEFYTAYTPYQPEISQGTLQAIFEYQSMICALTDMDVSNASMYDGSTATAEASLLAVEHTKRKNIIVSTTVNPQVRSVLKTYLKFKNINLIEVDEKEGITDIEKLESFANNKTAGIIVQNPNFFGIIEDMSDIEKIAHKNNSMLILSVDPISLGVLKTPGEIGADIVVGEGQSLGNSLSFGGPYLGFMAVKNNLMRKIPGRMVGMTEDVEGKRAFVLTLQAREQHIRREKAGSNICSNQGLNALCAAIYLTTLGKEGIKEIGAQCIKKSHYAYNEITKSGKYKLLFKKPFFKEFALKSDIEVSKINESLLQNNILGGYDLKRDYPLYNNSLLLCVTEKRTKKEIDELIKAMEGIK